MARYKPAIRRLVLQRFRSIPSACITFDNPTIFVGRNGSVEEPEATIHPGALESILEVLLAASETVQVIMTTHSPELLDAEWITDRHLRMVEWRQGATHVGPVSGANRTALQRRLMSAGELLRANALEPAPTVDDTHPPRLFESV